MTDLQFPQEIVDGYEAWEDDFIERHRDDAEPPTIVEGDEDQRGGFSIPLESCPSCDRPTGGKTRCRSCGRRLEGGADEGPN